MDGVDLALCRFEEKNDIWKYEILHAVTIPYSASWQLKLKSAHKLEAQDFLLLHNEYGNYIGNLAEHFLRKKPHPLIISFHGHTIFHQPCKRLTFQLGNGAVIAATTNITTISDFRSLDVALGGQGAPLVPIGDELLFHEYNYCLNLGGIANISFNADKVRIAYDICPVNQVLNNLASKKNRSYDKDGEIGALGKVNKVLLNSLNSLEYYSLKCPKSLSREWIENNIFPLLGNSGLSIEDQSATYYEHIAYQISKAVFSKGRMIITGGGARNKFLIQKIIEILPCDIVQPDDRLIDFKEALIFAFLGVLRFIENVNCLCSVTGAKKDSIGGTIYSVSRNDNL